VSVKVSSQGPTQGSTLVLLAVLLHPWVLLRRAALSSLELGRSRRGHVLLGAHVAETSACTFCLHFPFSPTHRPFVPAPAGRPVPVPPSIRFIYFPDARAHPGTLDGVQQLAAGSSRIYLAGSSIVRPTIRESAAPGPKLEAAKSRLLGRGPNVGLVGLADRGLAQAKQRGGRSAVIIQSASH
jgi:hypothetical protein